MRTRVACARSQTHLRNCSDRPRTHAEREPSRGQGGHARVCVLLQPRHAREAPSKDGQRERPPRKHLLPCPALRSCPRRLPFLPNFGRKKEKHRLPDLQSCRSSAHCPLPACCPGLCCVPLGGAEPQWSDVEARSGPMSGAGSVGMRARARGWCAVAAVWLCRLTPPGPGARRFADVRQIRTLLAFSGKACAYVCRVAGDVPRAHRDLPVAEPASKTRSLLPLLPSDLTGRRALPQATRVPMARSSLASPPRTPSRSRTHITVRACMYLQSAVSCEVCAAQADKQAKAQP